MLPTFEVFGISIPMFGVMMMCGMLAAFVLLWYTRKFIRLTEDQIFSAAIWVILLGFVGSKVLYWIVELDQVLKNPRFIIENLREGFVFYGALIGGVVGMYIYSRRSKLPFFAIFDLLAPSITLAQGFGRIGCFCAGCCYGCPSDAWCAVTYPAGGAAPAGVSLLPTQLFESAFLFLLTVVLVLMMKKRKPFGTVTGWYLTLYGVWRFIIEFFRTDDRGAVGSLSTSQFLGIFIVLAGIALLVLVKKGVLKTASLPHPADIEAEEAEELFPEESENVPGEEPETTETPVVGNDAASSADSQEATPEEPHKTEA